MLCPNTMLPQLQYMAMGLCDSFEEESVGSPTDLHARTDSPLFDDPKYMTSDQAKNQVSKLLLLATV